jgi:hypothetical protein
MSAIVFALDSERFAHRCAWSSTVRLKPWEGPFADLTQRLPQAPEVAAERNAARKRWRERQKAARMTQRSAA